MKQIERTFVPHSKIKLQYDPILRGLKLIKDEISFSLYELQYDPILRGLKPFFISFFISVCITIWPDSKGIETSVASSTILNFLLQYDPILRGLKPIMSYSVGMTFL